MHKILDRFVSRLVDIVHLNYKTVLEIGCGDGHRALKIGEYANRTFSIDSDIQKIRQARKLKTRRDVNFSYGCAELLVFPDSAFHIVIFSLSFHTIGLYAMAASIDEAIRVTKPGGFIVFLQPGTVGTFYEAQIRFDAGEGDNQIDKSEANYMLLTHPGLVPCRQYRDPTSYKFMSLNDFKRNMNPKKGLDEEIREFLERNNFTLREDRKVSIFRPR